MITFQPIMVCDSPGCVHFITGEPVSYLRITEEVIRMKRDGVGWDTQITEEDANHYCPACTQKRKGEK